MPQLVQVQVTEMASLWCALILVSLHWAQKDGYICNFINRAAENVWCRRTQSRDIKASETEYEWYELWLSRVKSKSNLIQFNLILLQGWRWSPVNWVRVFHRLDHNMTLIRAMKMFICSFSLTIFSVLILISGMPAGFIEKNWRVPST